MMRDLGVVIVLSCDPIKAQSVASCVGTFIFKVLQHKSSRVAINTNSVVLALEAEHKGFFEF